ncbi:hypothetical protein [Methanocella sp. MCL-LM]|uniref:hypothetical protein n=1 Tax=Methanocella sp. MCL-LM TaxID=3412035 RepID=UPI003C79011B
MAKKDEDELDSKAYDYLFQLYISSHDLFWSRINYYIAIETILVTAYIASLVSGLGWTINTIFLDVGLVLTCYIVVASLTDYKELLDYEKELSRLEPKVIGKNKIFKAKYEQRKTATAEFKKHRIYSFIADILAGIFLWFYNRYFRGIRSTEVILLILFSILVIWLAFFGLHVLGQDEMVISIVNGSY